MPNVEHSNDPRYLRQVIAVYEQEIKRLLERIRELTTELADLKKEDAREALQQELFRLQSRMDTLTRHMFGPSSERREGDNADPDENAPKGKKKQTGHGPRSQPKLPIEEVIHELDEPDRICPKCGKPLSEMDGHFEESEEITIIPPKVVLLIHKRKKYGCPTRDHIDTAPGPVKLLPGGRYSVDFAVEVAAAKYLEHMPLDRQVSRMSRLGLEVSVQTLFDQEYAAACALVPTWAALRRNLLCQEQLFADETSWGMITNDGREEMVLWSLNCPHAVWYTFSDSRSAPVARVLLEGFEGLLQCDGLSAYSALVENGGSSSTIDKFRYLHWDGGMVSSRKKWLTLDPAPIRLGLCWSHARRRFIECERNFYRHCKELLDLVRKLYAAEDEAKRLAAARVGPGACPEELMLALLDARVLVRGSVSKAVIADVDAWLKLTHALPSSALEAAKRYVRDRWAALTLFLEEPSLELDNNRSERSLRGPVVGRKNHYASHSERGLLVSAVFYSLFESAKLNGVNPVAYVKAALNAALQSPDIVLLPWNFLPQAQEDAA
jgi:transposase